MAVRVRWLVRDKWGPRKGQVVMVEGGERPRMSVMGTWVPDGRGGVVVPLAGAKRWTARRIRPGQILKVAPGTHRSTVVYTWRPPIDVTPRKLARRRAGQVRTRYPQEV